MRTHKPLFMDSRRGRSGVQWALLLSLGSLLLGFSGCKGSGGEGMPPPFGDTYTVTCACDFTRDGSDFESSAPFGEHTGRVCANATPTLEDQSNACREVAQMLNADERVQRCKSSYLVRDCFITCEPIADRLLFHTPDTCPLPAEASLSSALTDESENASSAGALVMGWANSQATYIGSVNSDASDVHIKIRKRGKNISRHQTPTGQVHLTSQCLGEPCELFLDGLDLQVEGFDINRLVRDDYHIRDIRITNLGRWSGTKSLDGSYAFAQAPLQVSAVVDGRPKIWVVSNGSPITGHIDGTLMTLESRIKEGDVSLTVHLHIPWDQAPPSSTTAMFPAPTIDGYRLDICREWGSNCGEPAALAFCQAHGYAAVVDWGSDPYIGAEHPTKVISTGQVCDQSFCGGFTHIHCVD